MKIVKNVIFKTGLLSEPNNKVVTDNNQSENDGETGNTLKKKTKGKTKYNIADLLKQVWTLHEEIYFDYQLSKLQQSFGGKVLALKLQRCYRQLSSFPMVTISLPTILCALLLMT